MLEKVNKNKIEFNRDFLKILILVTMTMDHIAIVLPVDFGQYMFLRTFGKLTIPLIAFFISEGFHYTHDRKKYFIRLFIFALISQIPFALAINFHELNVMYTLSLSLLFLMVWDSKKISKKQKVPIELAILVLSTFGDWKYYVPAMVLMHHTHNFKIKYLFPLVVLMILDFGSWGSSLNFSLLTLFGILLTPLILNFYNGKKGSDIGKMFFYWYYPLHLMILYIVSIWIK